MSETQSSHPQTEGPGPSGRKRKRSLDNSVPGSSKKARNKFAHRTKKPKKPSDWHLKRKDVPKDAEATKAALELHLRTLWRLPDQSAIPPKVTSVDKEPLTRRFSSESQVRSTVTASLEQNVAHIRRVQATIDEFLVSLTEGSTVSNNIKRISESHLLLMFRTVAIVGLSRWAPDILSDNPESLYNLLHEHIALQTFEQVSAAFGYSHMGINLPLVRDFPLMRKFYRSFVFSYMHDIAKLEAKSPGSVAKGKQTTTVYKRRHDLMMNRVDVLKAQGFNMRVLALASETEAHSDDELTEGDAIYRIKDKEGRAAKVKKFFRLADVQRQRIARAKRKQHKPERRREALEMPQVSELTTLPKEVPIDWFDPIYWNNSLTVRERVDYIAGGLHVALPLAEFWSIQHAYRGGTRTA